MYLPTQESGIRIRRERAKEGGKEIPCESLLGKLWPRYVCGSKGGIYSRGKTHSKKIFLHLLLLPFFQGQNEREAAGWRKRKRERETLSFPASSSLFAPPPLSSPLTPFRGSGERGIFRNAQEQKYRSKAPSFCRIVRLFSQKMCTEKGDRTFPSRFDFGFSFSLSPVFPFLPRRSCGEERKTLPTSAYSAK